MARRNRHAPIAPLIAAIIAGLTFGVVVGPRPARVASDMPGGHLMAGDVILVARATNRSLEAGTIVLLAAEGPFLSRVGVRPPESPGGFRVVMDAVERGASPVTVASAAPGFRDSSTLGPIERSRLPWYVLAVVTPAERRAWNPRIAFTEVP